MRKGWSVSMNRVAIATPWFRQVSTVTRRVSSHRWHGQPGRWAIKALSQTGRKAFGFFDRKWLKIKKSMWRYHERNRKNRKSIVYTFLYLCVFSRVSSRSLPQRLELDGIKELSQAKTVVEGLVWTVAVILSYFAAVYLPLLTVQRYSLGTTVVSIDNQPPVGSQIVFPRMMICHTPSWNKTYLEANVDIPEEISEKASKMGLNRAEILAQFAKYINSFYVLHVEDMDDDIWTLMTELYESVIKGNVQFVDLVWDAGFRGRYIYTSCKYNKKPFRCAQAQVPITMASCHGIQVGHHRLVGMDITR